MKPMFFSGPAVQRSTICIFLILLSSARGFSQDVKQAERAYPVSLLAAKTALQQLGAYGGTRLPTLEGFVKTDSIKLEQFQRPYYEFKIDLVPSGTDQTMVRVAAKISAWYAGGAEPPGYKVLETNGRLEADLLDRLEESLQKNGSPVVEPKELSGQIAEVHRKRLEVEQRISAIEQNANTREEATARPDSAEFATVVKANAPVLSSPVAQANVLMRAQSEDEFEIVEQRGPWLKLKMDEARTGWIQQSFVRSAKAASTNGHTPRAGVQTSLDGFTVLRENTQPFEGDWASLKGKTSRYIFVRPVGSSLNSSPVNKLRFAQTMFSERGRQTLHASRTTLEGIVIVFLDQGGGVAAASFGNIRLWLAGKISRDAFLKKCSLDPPSQFAAAPQSSKSSGLPKSN